MNEATIAQTILSAVMLAVILGFLVWGIKSGQFRDIEEAKYRMLADDESGDKCAGASGEGEGKKK